MVTKIFTRERLEELDMPRSAVHTEFVEERRWANTMWSVFLDPSDGAHWAVSWQKGATEYQEDTDPWFGDDEITAVRVESRPVTTEKWVEISAVADKPTVERLFLVTVKLPKNPAHNPRAKVTGPCPANGLTCTDQTGEHHTFIARGADVDDVLAQVRQAFDHVTRVEEMQVGAP